MSGDGSNLSNGNGYDVNNMNASGSQYPDLPSSGNVSVTQQLYSIKHLSVPSSWIEFNFNLTVNTIPCLTFITIHRKLGPVINNSHHQRQVHTAIILTQSMDLLAGTILRRR